MVFTLQQKLLVVDHHPVCAAKVAAQLFLIAQTPLLGEEGKSLRSQVHKKPDGPLHSDYCSPAFDACAAKNRSEP